MSAAFRVNLNGQPVQFRFSNVTFDGIRAIVSADVSQDINARAAKAANGADFASVGTVLDNLTVTQTSGTARAASSKIKDIFDARDWGCVADGSSQQTKVQEAIDDLASVPCAILNIPKGVKFDLGALDFTQNHSITIRYVLDDELNQPGYVGLGSGELCELEVKSGYPTDPTGGLVGERGVAAPLHATLVADTRADMSGVSAALGPGQSITDVVRGSMVLRHSLRDVCAITYINHTTAPRSALRASYFRSYRQTYVLGGVGSSAWATPPAVGDRVVTSGGGIGFVTAIDASTLTVLWAHGAIEVGQTLADSNESGIGPITSAAFTLLEMSPLAQSLDNGRWSINKRPGDARDTLSIGGGISVSPPDSFSQYDADASATWRYRWRGANPDEGASAGVVETEHPSRVWMHDDPDTGTARGMLGAVCASGRFGPALAVQSSSINFASVSKIGTGDYEVTFTRPMATTGYTTIAGLDAFYSLGYRAQPTFETVNTVRLRVCDPSGVLADIPANGSLYFVVTCGDIA